MEILTQVMTRSDSGTGARQRAGPGMQDSFLFAATMKEAMENAETNLPGMSQKPGTATADKDIAPAKPNIPDDDTDGNAALAAGVLGNQNMVVIVLEGDMESATTLDLAVDAAAFAETGAAENLSGSASGPGAATGLDTELFTTDTDAKASAASAAGAGKASEVAVRDENNGAANMKTTAGSGAPGNDDAAGGITGDVTARMPIKRTSEQQENEAANSRFSGKGNLSPLENENDATNVKGQKNKTYSETESAVRNAAGGMPESANTVPIPLADGIKPEQFRADQQMRQVATGAPVKAENLFQEMVSRIETMKSDSRSSMSIQLKPEYLGKVALEIAMDAAGLHVKINAADSGVRTMINGQINALIESLEKKGIEVVQVEVAYTGVDNGSFKESSEDQQSQSSHRQRRSYRETEAIDGAMYYSATPFETLDYYLDAGVSSVEYRA